jgi:hypothetical protein
MKLLPPLSSTMMSQPFELSPFGSQLCHVALNTYNTYYLRIYHDNANTKDYNGTIDSPSMDLSPSASIQGHRVNVLLSPLDPLSMESHRFFAIFILAKITKMQVRERTTVQNIEKW